MIPQNESLEGTLGVILVRGRSDQPTDGVEDYCTYLRKALVNKGLHTQLVRICWVDRGWLRALRTLWKEGAQWKEHWVLLQYTALSWSRRGFPFAFLFVIMLLKLRKVRIAVVFHDARAYPGQRWVDRLRRSCQHWVMQRALASSDRAIFPASVDSSEWLAPQSKKVIFIPVGSNIPSPHPIKQSVTVDAEPKSTLIAIFGVTEGERSKREITDTVQVMKGLAEIVPRIHLCVFGRGTKEAEATLRQALAGVRVELSVLGLLPAEQIGEILTKSDVQLELRNHISSRHGSVIAGITCGTPVVGFQDHETDAAICQAGVVLVPARNVKMLTTAIVHVLSDSVYREQLRQRNRIATQEWFSWEAISDQFLSALRTNTINKP